MAEISETGIKPLSFKLLKDPDVIKLAADDQLLSMAGNMEGFREYESKWINNAEKIKRNPVRNEGCI